MSLFDSIDDVVDTAIKVTTQPIKDTVTVFQGLTEGELRTKAIARLGADVVAGMALSEVIDLMGDD